MATIEDPPRFAAISTPEDYMSEVWFTWLHENVTRKLNAGLTVNVTLAKITGGGTDGELQFRNGLLVAITQPT